MKPTNTNTNTARPYFAAEKSFQSVETLVKNRLADLVSLQEQSAFYLRKEAACPPAYEALMKGVEFEARDLQYRVATLIESAENLALLFQETEQKIADFQETFESEGEASEEFTVSDAKVLVNESVADIEAWQY